MNMGNEILKDTCPQRFYDKSGIIKDTLPIIIAVVIVALFSGNLFSKAGINSLINLIIEVCFIFTFGIVFYFLFAKIKSKFSETYISVCENGICGVKDAGGFKNEPFCYEYWQINGVVSKGEKLLVDTVDGRFVILLENSENTARLINAMVKRGK